MQQTLKYRVSYVKVEWRSWTRHCLPPSSEGILKLIYGTKTILYFVQQLYLEIQTQSTKTLRDMIGNYRSLYVLTFFVAFCKMKRTKSDCTDQPWLMQTITTDHKCFGKQVYIRLVGRVLFYHATAVPVSVSPPFKMIGEDPNPVII